MKSTLKKILILDDSPPDNRPVFNMLVNRGYSVILSKKGNGCLTEISKQVDLVVFIVDSTKSSDGTIYKCINTFTLKSIDGTPLLFIVELPPSFAANKGKLKNLKELIGERALFSPFMEEELEHKIKTLLKTSVNQVD